jgi:CubicO group peptidase (beta-lactamase class C family)
MPTSDLTAITAHTGFTGSLEAIVPARQLVWALLRNRTRPQRTTQWHHQGTRLVGAAFLDFSSAV